MNIGYVGSTGRLLVSSIASLSLIAFPVAAQQNTRHLPTCGDFEYIEWNDEVISRQILDNCRMKNGLVVRGRYDSLIKDKSDQKDESDHIVEGPSHDTVEDADDNAAEGLSGNWGIAIGGLALAGLAAAAGGGNSGNTPSIPRVHPRTSPLPLPDNPTNPGS